MDNKAAELRTLADEIEAFLRRKRLEGIATSTLKNSYGYSLRGVLLPFCEAEGIERASDITDETLERLADQLRTKGGSRGKLSVHSVHTYLRAINLFLGWIKAGAKAPSVKLPRRQLRDTLSGQEVRSMIREAKSDRDRLIIRTLYGSGLRVGELVGLRVEDLRSDGRGDRARYFLHVTGKGAKDRDVPVESELWEDLNAFAAKERSRHANSEHLFIGSRRVRGGQTYAPLTESGVQQLIRNLAVDAEIQKRVHPHLFRHTYITRALNRGLGPMHLKEIVGHESTAMIDRVYSHIKPANTYDALMRSVASDDGEGEGG
jgi:site-specific recombinase XerD